MFVFVLFCSKRRCSQIKSQLKVETEDGRKAPYKTHVLHIFMLFNLLGPGTSLYRNFKINIRRKPNYDIGWFHNRPMIISHRLYAFHFTNNDFQL